MTTPIRPHPGPSGLRYLVALLALLLLTGLSLGMHFAHLGAASPVVAFGIAGIKVVIVGLVFMELRESLPATRLISVIAILFVALLSLGILGDVAFR